MSLKLETVLRSVPGVGTSRLALLEKLRLRTVADLLLLRPFRYEDRRDPGAIRDAIKGADQLMRGRVTAHGINRFKHGRKSVYELVLEDGTERFR